jgi:pimeloyl-ACP methyl ester carboxylesterase
MMECCGGDCSCMIPPFDSSILLIHWRPLRLRASHSDLIAFDYAGHVLSPTEQFLGSRSHVVRLEAEFSLELFERR